MAQLRALLVDYGGVLTNPLAESINAWIEQDRIDMARFVELMGRWLADSAEPNIVHELETGRISVADFERQLAAELVRSDGAGPPAAGLLTRMFAGFRADAGMLEVVRQVRAAGVRTGLVSNSWGLDYPTDDWGLLFDAVVISGEVGVRKPDPEIYRLAADRLEVEPEVCVFVDDLAPNVRGAAAVGMVGVQHVSLAQTVAELTILLDLPLRI